jgi:hypothetical protein
LGENIIHTPRTKFETTTIVAPEGTLKKYEINNPPKQEITPNNAESRYIFFKLYVIWYAESGELVIKLNINNPPIVFKFNVTVIPHIKSR